MTSVDRLSDDDLVRLTSIAQLATDGRWERTGPWPTKWPTKFPSGDSWSYSVESKAEIVTMKGLDQRRVCDLFATLPVADYGYISDVCARP